MDVAYTPNKKAAISLACCILLDTCSITTWFWAGGMQDSKMQTNQSMGCSRGLPMLLPKRSEEATFNNPSMRAGDTKHLEKETIAQRLKSEIVVVVAGAAWWPPFLPLGDRGGSFFPKPAPSAKEDTSTSKDRGLAAFPKFWAVSKITRSDAVGDVSPSPPPTNKFRKRGTVATIIPIRTPITGGGTIFLARKRIRFFWFGVVVVTSCFCRLLLFLLSLSLSSPNRIDRPNAQKKGDQPTRNMETYPVLSAR
mmetsp:Transcript_6611/g.14066  ORF Transcript_6611/g.14066 Transcript_6611/m.14066 type:complete len:252 (-) Transcript_6611:240-995(-)